VRRYALRFVLPNPIRLVLTGIKDAYLLARLLGDPSTTRSTLPSALQAYEAVRLPHTHEILHGSRLNGKNFDLTGPYGEDITQIGKSIVEVTKWMSELDPEDDLKKALKLMKELNEKNGE
jgi:salicylate hydroxylase